eukprot:6972221-Heterocapsa_arctica.AAC.1
MAGESQQTGQSSPLRDRMNGRCSSASLARWSLSSGHRGSVLTDVRIIAAAFMALPLMILGPPSSCK